MTSAAEWNQQHEVGEVFILRTDTNLPCYATTRSRAWTLGDGSVVVLLEGRTGGYSVDRLVAIEKQRTNAPRVKP